MTTWFGKLTLESCIFTSMSVSYIWDLSELVLDLFRSSPQGYQVRVPDVPHIWTELLQDGHLLQFLFTFLSDELLNQSVFDRPKFMLLHKGS